MRHITVYAPQDQFAGWPANNGLWSWENEILVGCSTGTFKAQKGHSVSGPIHSVLLRSLDGGESWTAEAPEGYLNDPRSLKNLDHTLDFTGDGFAMRVIGTGYHGTDEPAGGFFASTDRGHTWEGPYRFCDLANHAELQGLQMTPRTDYLATDPKSCLILLSARNPETWGADRVFCARTDDAGASFHFVSWIVPPGDPYRAVMPSTARCADGMLISAVRRRDMQGGPCWIDAYASTDSGESWIFMSRIGETGEWNGNPPALVQLRDGRLCCAYGNRSRKQMIARFSADLAQTWEPETILRNDFDSVDGEPDFGYPRLVQRRDGCLVAVYYWATEVHPQQHIAATIWNPTN
jgi:hypothetical protein